MISTSPPADARPVVSEIESLVSQLGQGRTQATAYDTAWGARLAAYYPDAGFDAAVEWLRRHQHEDGTWGGALPQYHDRFISTLAAIIALREVGRHPGDARRIERGERALWQLVGRLGRDDSDTVGFPILSSALVDEANALGLDVPNAPARFAILYRKKVESLLKQPVRDWYSTALTYSLEAFRSTVRDDDALLETNASVSISPSATAAYLMRRRDDRALDYIRQVAGALGGSGALPAAWPIDLFEIAWSLNQLHAVGVVQPDDPPVRALLDHLWSAWAGGRGVSPSTYWSVPDIDDTAALYVALTWGGYPASAEVFDAFEAGDYFCTYPGETNPSLSAHIRLLSALRMSDHQGGGNGDHERRIRKVVAALHRLDENGSFWWDKWHASPYYVSHSAIKALDGLDDDLVYSRFKWILRTQNDDGGWGYLGQSTAEETAYCLHALLYWDRKRGGIDATRVDAAAAFLLNHTSDDAIVPLWIAKSLYIPYYPVKSVILSALFDYLQWSQPL